MSPENDPIARLANTWRFPTEIRFGVGRIAELARACKRLGMTRPLLVTDPGLAALPMVADADAAIAIGDQVDTGTWFMNRCDYLDPALAWTGVKNSGRGIALSALGYSTLTRPKSFHLLTG